MTCKFWTTPPSADWAVLNMLQTKMPRRSSLSGKDWSCSSTGHTRRPTPLSPWVLQWRGSDRNLLIPYQIVKRWPSMPTNIWICALLQWTARTRKLWGTDQSSACWHQHCLAVMIAGCCTWQIFSVQQSCPASVSSTAPGQLVSTNTLYNQSSYSLSRLHCEQNKVHEMWYIHEVTWYFVGKVFPRLLLDQFCGTGSKSLHTKTSARWPRWTTEMYVYLQVPLLAW